jgi:hypothetical protein
MFFINNFKDLLTSENKRGFHANLNFNEFFIVSDGSVELKLISKFNTTITKTLRKNDAFYIPKNNWIEFKILDSNTIIFVLCDKNFESSISEYNFTNFLSL